MLALWILLGVIALLVLLLCIPVRLRLKYEGEAQASLSYLFLRFRLLPKEPGRKAVKKAAEETGADLHKGENRFTRAVREEGLSSAVEWAAHAVRAAVGRFLPLFRRVVVERLYLDIWVATGDAATTATEYGAVCAAVFPLRGFLDGILQFRKERIQVTPDFAAAQSRLRLELRLRLRPIFAVAAALRFVCDLLLYKWKNRKTKEKINLKDGAKV